MSNVSSTKKLSEFQLPIVGMSCASCVAHVEKALRKVAGVEHVSVNLATELAAFGKSASKRGMARLVAGRGIGPTDLTLDHTDAADGVWEQLEFVRLVAIGVRYTGAILARCTFLPCRLARIEGRNRQYGL